MRAPAKQKHEAAARQHVAACAGRHTAVMWSPPKAQVAVEGARKQRLVHDCAARVSEGEPAATAQRRCCAPCAQNSGGGCASTCPSASLSAAVAWRAAREHQPRQRRRTQARTSAAASDTSSLSCGRKATRAPGRRCTGFGSESHAGGELPPPPTVKLGAAARSPPGAAMPRRGPGGAGRAGPACELRPILAWCKGTSHPEVRRSTHAGSTHTPPFPPCFRRRTALHHAHSEQSEPRGESASAARRPGTFTRSDAHALAAAACRTARSAVQ